jgi:hypothetical protein
MTTIAITSLPVVTTGTVSDVIPIVQNGSTSQITNANLFNSVDTLNGLVLGLGNSNVTSNVAIGNDALLVNTTGNNNVAIGNNTLKANTIGIRNAGLGYASLLTNTSGSYNTGAGALSLALNTGSNNTAIGFNSGGSITTGAKNTIIGNYSGSSAPINQTGSNYVVLSDGDGNVRAYWNGADATFNGALTAAGNVLVNSSSAKIGYTTGAGNTVTQLTSRTTGVTLNTPVGQINTFTAAGSTAATSFIVTNSSVGSSDVIVLNQSGATNLYILAVTQIIAGSFRITFYTTGGTVSDTLTINFAVIKGAIS